MQQMTFNGDNLVSAANEQAGTLGTIITGNYPSALQHYIAGTRVNPLLLLGDSIAVLKELPDSCIDFAMTSPPYWGKRGRHWARK
jgi:hypothetical protein